MINLMPDVAKKELRAARTNVVLLRYLAILIGAAAFLALVIYGSIFLLSLTKNSSQQLIDANDTKAAIYSDTKQQVSNLSSQLIEAKSALDQEVSYSQILISLGQLMTPGTIIDKLSIGSEAFEGKPVTLKIFAKSTDATVTLRDRFQSSSLFSDVQFETISDSSGGIDGYPVSATLTLTFVRSSR